MLTDQQLQHLKNLLVTEKNNLEENITEEYGTLQENNSRESTGELSLYDNHPADMGTELYEREKDLALSIHSKAELDKVHDALNALEKGTYGKCEVCGKDIPFERLEAIPYTTFCVEHTSENSLASDRPVEEDILKPPMDNSFAGRHKGRVKDYNDSFQEVAHFGTSETPSDFEGDFDDYGDLYSEDTTEGFTEEYEIFSASEMDGQTREVIQSEQEEKYLDELDEEGTDTPFGDLHFKRTDGYVENDEEQGI